MRRRLHLIILLVMGLMFAPAGLPTALADTDATSGHTDWEDWSLDWEISSLFDGVSLQNVTYKGRQILSRASHPVMRVYYDSTCGPYSDRIGGTTYPIPWANDRKVAHRTYTRADGSEWLEIGIYDRLGSYKIYQAWYLSSDGILDAHLFSSGLQCNINHRHYPYWRMDFDLDGASNDAIQRLAGADWVNEDTEFDAVASSQFRVIDQTTGTSVKVLSGPGDWGIPGQSSVPNTTLADHAVFGRRASSVPVGDYQSMFGIGIEGQERPNSSGASLTGQDVAIVYRARMNHLSAEGSTLWHSSGPRFIVDVPPSNGAPVAVASADQPVGQAPHQVRFSAAGSSDPDGDPLSYAWDFGDGQSSSEASPTHTYTAAGNYDATLTVSDGNGESDTSTISIAVDPANRPPLAAATATPLAGAAPLAVTFSAAGSSDPDSDPLGYSWDFTSDGSADAAGPTATHRYLGAGTYIATLTVSDGNGGIDSDTVAVSVSATPPPEDDPVGEAGRVTLSQPDRGTWRRVTLSREYRDPIVVMGPFTRAGAHPSVARVRRVTSTSFEFKIDEWNYLDGSHTRESVGWVVMERGVHTLSDGRVVEAGRTSTDHRFSGVAFTPGAGLGPAPVVLTQTASLNGGDTVATRIRNVSATGFEVKLQEQESLRRTGHRRERLDWLALRPGGGNAAVARTGDVVTHRPHTVRVDVAARPVLLGAVQSHGGSDPSTLRLRTVGASAFSFFVEEERSSDREVAHTTETVGYAAFPVGPIS